MVRELTRTRHPVDLSDTLTNTSLIRRRWRLTGQVQGVGFRPFVYRLARGLALGAGTGRRPPGLRRRCELMFFIC